MHYKNIERVLYIIENVTFLGEPKDSRYVLWYLE